MIYEEILDGNLGSWHSSVNEAEVGEMEKAYGYIRVSGQGQVDGDGFRRQTDEIENYCKTAKIELVNVFEEKAISGTVDETQRPAFQEMIQAILKNGVKTVIVERMDRLAREYRIQETLLIYMASKGIQLINAGTGENVTEAISSDPMKKALIQMQGIFAELEKNLLVKKLRSAREAKRLKNGKCEGRKSYAESAPETLAKIKALYRKPRNGERKTLQEIADALNAEGILTLDGQQWSKANVHRVISAN